MTGNRDGEGDLRVNGHVLESTTIDGGVRKRRPGFRCRTCDATHRTQGAFRTLECDS